MSESKFEVDEYGNKHWKNKEGLFHRVDGPAVENVNGGKYWLQNGKFHRIDGPAVEDPNLEKRLYAKEKPLYVRGKRCYSFPEFIAQLTEEEKEVALFNIHNFERMKE